MTRPFDPLDTLVVEGKKLLQKVRRHYPAGQGSLLPPDQQVTDTEWLAWFRGVGASLETAFGADSYEVRTWKFRRQESEKKSSDMAGEGISPEGESFMVQLLAESIGILAEIRLARMGSQSQNTPSLKMELLHPKIAPRAVALLAVDMHDEAVSSAFKTIEQEVRQRGGFNDNDHGKRLLSEALNARMPRLRVRSEYGDQWDIHDLFKGAFGIFRNPSVHRTNEYPDVARVMEILAFASLLMHLLDSAKVTGQSAS